MSATIGTATGEFSVDTHEVDAIPDGDPYAWIITEDRVTADADDLPSRVGVTGPGNAFPSLYEAVKTPGPHRIRFRTYDDDGVYCYGGYLAYDPDLTGYLKPSWQPLGDFGMPDAGCTRIAFADRPDLDYS